MKLGMRFSKIQLPNQKTKENKLSDELIGDIFDSKTKLYTPLSYINDPKQRRTTLGLEHSKYKDRQSILKVPKVREMPKVEFKKVKGPPNIAPVDTDILRMLEAHN